MARLSRNEAQDMGEVMRLWVKEMRLGSGLNEQRIMAAWDRVSGVGSYTLGKYVKGGVLFVSLSSSVLRSSLMPRLKQLTDAVNAELREDPLFSPSDQKVGFIKSISLR